MCSHSWACYRHWTRWRSRAGIWLTCGLTPHQASDREESNFQRQMFHHPGHTHTLLDLGEWLRYKSWFQDYDIPSDIRTQGLSSYQAEKRYQKVSSYGSTWSRELYAEPSNQTKRVKAHPRRDGKAKQNPTVHIARARSTS